MLMVTPSKKLRKEPQPSIKERVDSLDQRMQVIYAKNRELEVSVDIFNRKTNERFEALDDIVHLFEKQDGLDEKSMERREWIEKLSLTYCVLLVVATIFLIVKMFRR